MLSSTQPISFIRKCSSPPDVPSSGEEQKKWCPLLSSLGSKQTKWVKYTRQCQKDVVLHQPLKALYQYETCCNRAVIIKTCDAEFLGDTDMIVADLKHDGTTACSSVVLKMSIEICVSLSVNSLITGPWMLLGPATFCTTTLLIHCTCTPYVRLKNSFLLQI